MTRSRKIEIGKLKEFVNGEFEKKYISEAKQITGMDIIRNRKKSELLLFWSS